MGNSKRANAIQFLVFSAIAVMLAGIFPASAANDVNFPQLTGPYAVGRSVYRWTDSSREETYTETPDDPREVEVWVWYPAEATADAQPAPYLTEGMSALFQQMFGIDAATVHSYAYADALISSAADSYPVLVFSHGNGSNSAFYASLLEEIASHGYIVFGIDHSYNTLLNTLADGQVVPGVHEAQDQSEDDFAVRLDDVHFVIDQLEQLNGGDDALAGKLDLAHLGIFGHSFGGATAAEACHDDTRCQVAAVLDVPLQGKVASEGLSQPIMILSAEQLTCAQFIEEAETIIGQPAPDGTADMCESMNAVRDVTDQTVLEASTAGYRLHINGARHGNFGDISFLLEVQPSLQNVMGGFASITAERGWRVSSDYLLAFFDQYLKDEPTTLLTGAATEYPEVVFETSVK